MPGVRELFETEAPGNAKKTRAELMKVIFSDTDASLEPAVKIIILMIKAQRKSIAEQQKMMPNFDMQN